MNKLTFYGHACFQLANEQYTLLFDPFLNGNPQATAKPEDIKCQYILLSHAHDDHLGDAVAIAKRNQATIISTAEVARLCGEQGCQVHAMHVGGTYDFPFGRVRLTPAFHGAGVAGGHACGFVVGLGGTNVYFAGDTALFGDMALLGKLVNINCALLPIGGNFTMDPADAAVAAEMLKPDMVIPMHYNTWPVIAQSPDKFKLDVEKRCGTPVIIMNPGDTITL